MFKIVFKNLEKSEIAKDFVEERISELIDKFPDLKKSNILVTLEMHNSPQQAGPDSFSICMRANGGKYDGVSLTKYAQSLYVALADLVEHALEILNMTRQVLGGELIEIGRLRNVSEELFLITASRKIENPIASKIMSTFSI